MEFDCKKSNRKHHKNCKKCQYPCVNSGENLIPITVDELRKIGYVLCDEYTEEFTIED